MTYSSFRSHEGLTRLHKSFDSWGWDFKPIIGPWNGFQSKMNGVFGEIDNLEKDGYTHLLFTDAFDTLCVGPPSEAIARCDHRMLISCEIMCWPDVDLVSEYPRDPWSRWRFVNSGGYLGPLSLLREVLDGACGDDQLWLTRKYLSEWNKEKDLLRRDDCEIFQTLGHTIQDWSPWYMTFDKVPGGRIRNKETGTMPIMMHGNGADPKLMTWLEDHPRSENLGPI